MRTDRDRTRGFPIVPTSMNSAAERKTYPVPNAHDVPVLDCFAHAAALLNVKPHARMTSIASGNIGAVAHMNSAQSGLARCATGMAAMSAVDMHP